MAPHSCICMAPPLGIRGSITGVVILLTGVDNQIIRDTVLTTSARGLITGAIIPTINVGNFGHRRHCSNNGRPIFFFKTNGALYVELELTLNLKCKNQNLFFFSFC